MVGYLYAEVVNATQIPSTPLIISKTTREPTIIEQNRENRNNLRTVMVAIIIKGVENLGVADSSALRYPPTTKYAIEYGLSLYLTYWPHCPNFG